MKRFLFLAMLLTGCSINLSSGGDGIDYYDLGVVPTSRTIEPAAEVPSVNLLIGPMLGPSLLSGQRIVFAQGDNKVGSYQFSLWSESPIKRLNTLLLSALVSEHVAQNVSRLTGASRGDVLLQTELLKFIYDIRKKPYRAEVMIRAELLSLKDGKIFAQQIFSQDVETSRADAEDAVAGLSQASVQVVEQVVRWTQSNLSQQR